MTLHQLTADLYHIMKSHSKVMVFCAICHLSASDLPFFAPAQSCYKHKLLKINNYSIQLVSDFGIFCISRKRSLKNHQPESTSEIIITVILQISIFCPPTHLNTVHKAAEDPIHREWERGVSELFLSIGIWGCHVIYPRLHRPFVWDEGLLTPGWQDSNWTWGFVLHMH